MSDLLIRNVELDGVQTDIRVENGRFVRIAPNQVDSADRVLDALGLAIMPSFVNGHTHAAMSLLRSYADDRTLHDWLENYIWPAESALTEEDIYHGTRLACLEMIRSGTTCFNDMYWHFEGIVRAVEESGMRAVLSSVFIDFGDQERALAQQQDTERLWKASKACSERIQFALGPHAIYTVSEASLQWIAHFAETHGLMVHIHLSETQKEVEDCLVQHGMRPVEYLEHLGVLNERVIAAHAIHLSDSEIHLLAQRRVKVVHNPASNMKLSSGSFAYQRLRDAGVEILLGTDGNASNNNLDMLEEMKLAALHAKLVHNNPTTLPAKDIFNIATSDGAKALGLDAGRIQEGSLADCLLVDLFNHRLTPGYDLVADMVYSADSSCIHSVICDGRILMENGIVPGEQEIIEQARAYSRK